MKSQFNRRKKIAPQKSKHFKFGDLVICDYPHPDGTHKIRPVIIVGVFKNNIGDLFYAVHSSTTQYSNYPCSLRISNKMETLPTKTEKQIMCSQVAIVHEKQLHLKKGIISQLKKQYIPDLIARRIQGLLFNPKSSFSIFRNPNKIIHAQHYPLDDIIPDFIPSGQLPFDAQNGLHKYETSSTIIEHPTGNISKDDIKALTQWVALHSKQGVDTRTRIEFPPVGTWPNWPPLEINGQKILCHAKEHGTATQAPKTDVKRMTAAQKRLRNFSYPS